jgi:hypothetical protein
MFRVSYNAITAAFFKSLIFTPQGYLLASLFHTLSLLVIHKEEEYDVLSHNFCVAKLIYL